MPFEDTGISVALVDGRGVLLIVPLGICACICANSLQPFPTLCSPMDHTRQAPLSMGFVRQEFWSGLPLPSPGDLPNQGTGPATLKSPALVGRFFNIAPPGKSRWHIWPHPKKG